jgi:hypothetical protein
MKEKKIERHLVRRQAASGENAQREALDLIVQVPYLRCGERAPLQASGGEVEIQSPIWDFFRNVSAVAGLPGFFKKRSVQ